MAALAERYGLPPPRRRRNSCVPSPARRGSACADRDPRSAKAVDDHLADSLVALELEPVRAAGKLADLGSGAGLPGLPLAIALPETSVALVESALAEKRVPRARRGGVRMQRTLASSTHAPRPGPRAWRLSISSPPARWRRLAVVVEYAAPLLVVGGALVAWRGTARPARRGRGGAARRPSSGSSRCEIRQVQPYPGAENRYLHLMSKVMETPSGFPRRPGMALQTPARGDIATQRNASGI